MLIIGELINGMFKNVEGAIKERNKTVIADLAKRQCEAGAKALDINVGPAAENPVAAMQWLVETVQETGVDARLCIDSTKPDVVEAGLKAAQKKALINSTTADDQKLEKYIALTKQYNAQLIGLTTDKRGIPSDSSRRCELALKIISQCIESGIDQNDVYIDPVVLPVNVAQAQLSKLLEAMRDFRMLTDPPPKTVVGLSNVSQGTKNRRLINRTFLVMLIAYGLEAAILDPLDKELIKNVHTAELLLNKELYCDSYLEAAGVK
jgi:5-methyltetrahydrofolate corrinoid/iron sulfur protein methyltransferase